MGPWNRWLMADLYNLDIVSAQCWEQGVMGTKSLLRILMKVTHAPWNWKCTNMIPACKRNHLVADKHIPHNWKHTWNSWVHIQLWMLFRCPQSKQTMLIVHKYERGCREKIPHCCYDQQLRLNLCGKFRFNGAPLSAVYHVLNENNGPAVLQGPLPLTSFPVDMTATTGNFWTSTSVTPTVARRPISDGPMWVPFASTHSPRLMSWPIGLWWHSRENGSEEKKEREGEYVEKCPVQLTFAYSLQYTMMQGYNSNLTKPPNCSQNKHSGTDIKCI